MRDSIKGFQVEKISDRGREAEETFIIAERPVAFFLNGKEFGALLATPENLKQLASGFMLSAGWLREDKPVERIKADPRGRVCVQGDYRNPDENLLPPRTNEFLTRPSRNQKGILPQKSPPFVKGGPGGISEICCQFAHNVISKRLRLKEKGCDLMREPKGKGVSRTGTQGKVLPD